MILCNENDWNIFIYQYWTLLDFISLEINKYIIIKSNNM